MSCSGCRVLRRGCSDLCVLRPSIEWIESPTAQAQATLFVAKFFGRAGLIASLSTVPEPHRAALFRSLLYEACGRTINPVNGAIGLMWSGNWDLCEAAAETVCRGGSLQPMAELGGDGSMTELYGPIADERPPSPPSPQSCSSSGRSAKRKKAGLKDEVCDLGLCLVAGSPERSPSEGSVMTSEEGSDRTAEERPALLNLFL